MRTHVAVVLLSSRDPAPLLRAPTFDEAAFTVAGEPVVTVGVRGR